MTEPFFAPSRDLLCHSCRHQRPWRVCLRAL